MFRVDSFTVTHDLALQAHMMQILQGLRPFVLQEASFQEFCQRPENRDALEKVHEKQSLRQLNMQQHLDAVKLRDRVCSLSSGTYVHLPAHS